LTTSPPRSGRQRAGDAGHPGRVERIAHGDIDAERETFHRLEGRFAIGLGALAVAIELVTQGIALQAIQAGDHHDRAITHLGDAAGELIDAKADFTALYVFQR
jgi:hypothetical protein